MAKQINKTQEVLTKLRAEHKIADMNTAKDVELISAFDKRMEVVRRDYQIKERNSQYTAAKVILTA
jgi:7-cyano-7-deazaguanine synthase in queuosine biosynthesis